MRTVLIGIVVFALTLCGYSQTVKVNFVVWPMSDVTIKVDDKEFSYDDKKSFAFGFNVRKNIVDHRVVISAPRYEEKAYHFTTESPSRQNITCNLERTLRKFDHTPDFYIDIEKIVSGIEYSTEVGGNTRWKYRYNEEIELGVKKRKLSEAIKKMGLRTLDDKSDNLFDVGRVTIKNPDILIAGRVESFELEHLSGSASGFYKSKISVNWQLFDRLKKEIILKRTIESEYRFATNLVSEEFFNAIIENFYNLSDDSEFYNLLNGYAIKRSAESSTQADSSDANTIEEELLDEVEPIKIQHVRPIESSDFSDLVGTAMRSSVTVIIDEDKGHGSGVVISTNGYIVTNHHVINEANIIDVQFENGIVLPADVITYSEKHDLALIKVRASGLSALAILQNADELREGAELFVVGAPADRELGQSVSKGVLSGKRTLDGMKVIQTDTKISPGNSGSPLVNGKGQIIGIINMKMVGEGVEGLSFAIDAGYLFSVLGIQYE
jgi:hypothetical protein